MLRTDGMRILRFVGMGVIVVVCATACAQENPQRAKPLPMKDKPEHLGVGAAAPAWAVPLTAEGRALLWIKPQDPPYPAIKNQTRASLEKLGEKANTLVMSDGDRMTRAGFGDMRLHVEWLSPAGGISQLRGNSGVYIQDRYELQILNNGPDEALHDNDAGAIYGLKPPDINASHGPGQWQAYDVIFRAARFNADGEKIKDARITVYWNGTLIHKDYALPHGTGAGKRRDERPTSADGRRLVAPLRVQDHTSLAKGPVRFRNIWVGPIDGEQVQHKKEPWQRWLANPSEHEADGFHFNDGTVIARAVADSVAPVVGDASYTDFELTCEVKVAGDGVMSGILLRTSEGDNRMGGYKVVVCDDQFGGIVQPGTGEVLMPGESSWLFPLSTRPAARDAYKRDGWNELRIVAKGPVIRTWVNGTRAAAVFDSTSLEGQLGLLASVDKGGGPIDGQVMFRNIKVRRLEAQREGHDGAGE